MDNLQATRFVHAAPAPQQTPHGLPLVGALLLAVLCWTPAGADAANVSRFPVQWQPMTIDVPGPASTEESVNPNPFLDRRLTVRMQSPEGDVFNVPGFFAGNGLGHGAGSIWRVRFTPDQPGEWRYEVSFVAGTEVAVNGNAGTPLADDGSNGRFDVSPRDPDAPGLLAAGPLDYVGEHYLKQPDGDYWIKAGIDSPENFFGYAGFDDTIDQPGGVGTGALTDGVHRYAPHIADWREGDPLFRSNDRGVDSKGIIGAINYLADEGVNSIYFLPMNLGGDGQETYPFLGTSGSRTDNTHYDVSKLHQWNLVLNHMQRRGILAHIVLGEQEEPNTRWLDDGELGVERKLFYRELVARFAYLNGVKWNLAEESRYGSDRHKAFAAELRALDWAAHPIAVHTWADNPALAYEPLLGVTDFDATSIQFSPANSDEYTETWRQRSRDAGWKWVVDMDEIGPAGTGLSASNADELRRSVLYPVYFSGGNIEWYFGYHGLPVGGDMRTEDFRTRQAMYRYMNHARRFMQEHLPFERMEPADALLLDGDPNDQVFALAGDTYALYLNDGLLGKMLEVEDNTYSLRWFDPLTGLFAGGTRSVTGASVDIGPSPRDTNQDWVVLLQRIASDVIEPVISAPTTVDPTPSTPTPTLPTDETSAASGGTDEPPLQAAAPNASPAQGESSPQTGALGWLMTLGLAALARRRLLRTR